MALATVADNEHDPEAMRACIVPLQALVRDGEDVLKENGARLLGKIALCSINRRDMGGCIQALNALARIGNDMEKEAAAYALGHIACFRGEAAYSACARVPGDGWIKERRQFKDDEGKQRGDREVGEHLASF